MKIINNLKSLYYRRKGLRNNSTSEEILLWLRLRNSQLGSKFRRQHSIGGYIVDFYCPSKKLIIEIDGPNHSTKENKEYDEIRTEFLKGLDIKILRFTNKEINHKIEEVIQKIISVTFSSPPCGGGVPMGQGGD